MTVVHNTYNMPVTVPVGANPVEVGNQLIRVIRIAQQATTGKITV